MRRRRGIMGLNVGAVVPVITATATGNPLSFVTDMVRPLKSLVIPFTPIQEGTGDPSPDNVRPISGWTGCEIGHAKKNLFDKTAVTITTQHCINYTTGGITGLSTSRQGYTSFVPIKGDTTYTISGISFGTGTNIGHAFYSSNDASTYISGVNKNSTGYTTFTTPSDAKYARFSIIVPSGSSAASQIDVIQLELGSSATTYEAYQGSTKTINWQSSAGTVYGGTVTLNEDGSADLVEDWYHFTWDGVTNKATRIYGGSDESQQYVNFYSYISILEKNIVGTRWVHNTVICDTLSEGSTGNPEAYHGNVAINYCYIYIRKDVLSEVTVTGVNAYLQEHPVTFSGKALDGYFTPNVYHFDNIGQLITFIGTNNIWTDTNGTNTATYLKHQS